MKRARPWMLLPVWCAVVLAGCTGSYPRFTPREKTGSVDASDHELEGTASYYGEEFNGRRTANGEVYDMNALTAAHRTLPFNTRVRVVNRQNGRSVVVRINDRGPFKSDRVIDVSLAAAKQLGMIGHGTAGVDVEVLEMGAP